MQSQAWRCLSHHPSMQPSMAVTDPKIWNESETLCQKVNISFPLFWHEETGSFFELLSRRFILGCCYLTHNCTVPVPTIHEGFKQIIQRRLQKNENVFQEGKVLINFRLRGYDRFSKRVRVLLQDVYFPVDAIHSKHWRYHELSNTG